MKNLTKRLIAGGLTFLGATALVSAEDKYENISKNYIGLDGAGILSIDNAHCVNKNSRTEMNSIFSDYAWKNAYAIDPIIGLTNILKWLNSDEAKTKYTEANREHHIDRFQKLLSEVNKEKRGENYQRSLARLSSALEDGVLNPYELKDVENGIYIVVARGRGGSVPALVEIKGLEKEAKGLEREADSIEKKVSSPFGEFVMGTNINLDSFGFDLGGRYNFNDKFGIGLGGRLIIIPGKETLNVITNMSEKGIYSHINKVESGTGIGPYLDLRVDPFVFRGGFNCWSTKEKSTVQGMKYDEHLGDPIVSQESFEGFSSFGGASVRIPLHEQVALEIGAGYDGKIGPYGSVAINTNNRGQKPTRRQTK